MADEKEEEEKRSGRATTGMKNPNRPPDQATAPSGLAPYNADIDPTRLQPYGNPHARVGGIGVTETDSTKEMRQSVAEELAEEGESSEENKSKGGQRARTAMDVNDLGEDVVPLEGSEGFYVDNATGKIYREDGTLEAVLAAPAADVKPIPVNVVNEEPQPRTTEERAKPDPGPAPRTETNKTS